ncbi:hypothetical protein [Ralstonia pseudosolanacearum]
MTLPYASNRVGEATVLMGRLRTGELVALLDRLIAGELVTLLAALLDRLRTETSGLGERAGRLEEPSSHSCVRPREDPDECVALRKLFTLPMALLISISCVDSVGIRSIGKSANFCCIAANNCPLSRIRWRTLPSEHSGSLNTFRWLSRHFLFVGNLPGPAGIQCGASCPAASHGNGNGNACGAPRRRGFPQRPVSPENIAYRQTVT